MLHDDDCNKSCEADSNEENTDNQIIEMMLRETQQENK